MCLFPFVVAAKVQSVAMADDQAEAPNPNPNPNQVQGVAMAATIAFLGVTMMYSLNEVARELEDPYTAELGSSANRLQAAAMHSDFNERLLIFHRNGRGRPLRSPAA